MEQQKHKNKQVLSDIKTSHTSAVPKSSGRRRPQIAVPDYVKGILSGDRTTLSRAITLIESTRPDHQSLSNEILEACIPHVKQAIRVGISGSPGVGKSTFIEAIGQEMLQQGHKVAVLAIDPSSSQSRGSILGDKTRMHKLGSHPGAFIRPSPAGTTLGGVARKTRETILLCEAAGFDYILIETVGVGQSEIAVHSMVDCFLLLLLPGAGDELQGIKRGIVEMADLVVVNKADGERMQLAKQARRAYKNSMHLFPAKQSGYTTKVMTCSALESTSIVETYEEIKQYIHFIQANQFFDANRKRQRKYWLEESVRGLLLQFFKTNKAIAEIYPEIEQQVVAGTLLPFQAAERLMERLS